MSPADAGVEQFVAGFQPLRYLPQGVMSTVGARFGDKPQIGVWAAEDYRLGYTGYL